MDEHPTPYDSSPAEDRLPQSPASKGIRAGLFVALAAALMVLAANESWLLPSMDADGVAWFHAAAFLAEGGDQARVPVAHWSASDSLAGLERGPAAVPRAMAAVIRTGARAHVAALWFLAGSMALLVLVAAWVAGGASAVEGGLLAGLLLLASPLAVEAGTALRPEALAAAFVVLQLGAMAYRPRWHVVHGAAGALAWALHPAGAGAVAAAVVWPFLPAPAKPAPRGRVRDALPGAILAALPAVVLLVLGPGVPWLPSLPPVLDQGVTLAPLAQLLGWAGAGMAGAAGIVVGLVALAGAAVLIYADAAVTPPVDPSIPWHHPRTPDLVAARARAASLPLLLGLALAASAGGWAGELERSGLLLVAPVAVLVALAATRWITGARGSRRWIVAGGLGAWVLISTLAALGRHGEIRARGRGLAEARWIEAGTVRWLDNQAPRGAVVYASSPYLILFQTGHAVRTIPPPSEGLEAFAAAFALRPGVVVLDGADTVRTPAFSDALGLAPVVRDGQAVILGPADPGER